MRLFSTEQVSKYHPDKLCDQISDAILTACLRQDPHSHCGIEVMAKDYTIVLGGEITTTAMISPELIARGVCDRLHYNVDKVINLISKQSPEIGAAVDGDVNIGAGDQGMMYGYACNDTDSLLPYGFDLANKIIKLIEDDVEGDAPSILYGDAKTQVTVDLDKEGKDSVYSILISVCHVPEATLDEVRDYVYELMKPLELPKEVKWIINPSGTWTIGGPVADCGLTGRKIVCDQYGGYCAVGGGAFSGKDPSKVDRSGAYMARYIACDILQEYDLEWCEVQLAYAIGMSHPVSVSVKNDRGIDFSDEVIRQYDLTPAGIIEYLDLYHVNYTELAAGCHYRIDFRG